MLNDCESSFLSVDKDVSDWTNTSSSWIKENMLGSPPKRVLTEAEVRVQRALQKLDIPEWYLNKTSKAPKILKNDTPIDYRQPSWKRGVKPKISSTNKSVLETTFDSTDSKLAPPNLNETFVKSPKPFSLNKSGTFPKISPSRKVQNINIIFPPTSTFPVQKIPNSSPPSSPLETTFESDVNSNLTYDDSKLSETFESSFTSTADDKFNTPRRNKLAPTSCFKTNLANAVSAKPFSQKMETPYKTPDSELNIRADSTLESPQQTLFTSTLDKPTPSPRNSKPPNPIPKKLERIFNFSTASTSQNSSTRSLSKQNNSDRKQSTYWLGEVTPYGPDCPGVCKECGAKPPRIYAALTTTSTKNPKDLFNEESLTRKFEKVLGNLGSSKMSPPSPEEKQREIETAARLAKVINEKTKALDLTKFVKVTPIMHGNNLAQEIIREFRDKCTVKSTATYTSPGTKHFVNRLVNDLRAGNVSAVPDIPDIPEEEEVESELSDSDSGSRSNNDIEANSAALSTSLSVSFKDSGSESDSAPVTSTLKSNVDKSRFNKEPVRSQSDSYEEDGVFWIPIKLYNMPKMGPQTNMLERSESPTRSISPISVVSDFNQHDEAIYQNFCETTGYKPKEESFALKNPSQVVQTRVLDSGFADRFSSKFPESDSSLSDGSWFEDTDSSPAESENSFALSSVSDRVFLGKKSGVYVL